MFVLYIAGAYVAIEADPVVLFPRMQPGPRTKRWVAYQPQQNNAGRVHPAAADRQAGSRAAACSARFQARCCSSSSIKLGPSLRLCSVFQSSTAVDSEQAASETRMDRAASAVPSTFKG